MSNFSFILNIDESEPNSILIEGMKKLGLNNDCSFREEQPMDEEEDMDIKFDDEMPN